MTPMLSHAIPCLPTMDHHPQGHTTGTRSLGAGPHPGRDRALLMPTTEPESRKGTRVRMAQFLGTHQNKLDAKGRVSIPAQFRSVLKQMSHAGEGARGRNVVLRPSHQTSVHRRLDRKRFRGAERAAGARLRSVQPGARGFGRWRCTPTLPAGNRQGRPDRAAGRPGRACRDYSRHVVFIGLGTTFQIWEPAPAPSVSPRRGKRHGPRGLTLRATVPA